MTEPNTLAEFQANFSDDAPAPVTYGQWRQLRGTAGRLSRLQGWVDLYLDGRASAAELTAAVERSKAVA